MKIESPAFKNNGPIPSKYTCDGENINPELLFFDVPAKVQSLTLIFHDPDAPKAGGWTHWVLVNMDPRSSGIQENSRPTSGFEATSDYQKTAYGGPCPPTGIHRYYFYLYALDSKLGLDPRATKKDVEQAMEGHILEKTELMGFYNRSKGS